MTAMLPGDTIGTHDRRYYYISQLAPKLDQDQIILLGLSGRGDKLEFVHSSCIG